MLDLRTLKVSELRDVAREYCIVSAWKMTKDRLIERIIANAELNGHINKYFDSEAQDEPEQTPDAPELIEEPETDNLSDSEESPSEHTVEPSNNGWEEIAKENIKHAYDWITGEHENSVNDGEMTQEEFNKWIANEAIDQIYHEAITTKYYEDATGGPAPTEMRFAGKEFCMKFIKNLLKADGYLDNSNLKGYGAWVVDRRTKELTTVVAEATSREAFYLSIKGQYRVRLITKPEKLEEECKQWEIRHARNKVLKNEKYAADKAEATKLGMKVHEYRKHLRESAKTGK